MTRLACGGGGGRWVIPCKWGGRAQFLNWCQLFEQHPRGGTKHPIHTHTHTLMQTSLTHILQFIHIHINCNNSRKISVRESFIDVHISPPRACLSGPKFSHKKRNYPKENRPPSIPRRVRLSTKKKESCRKLRDKSWQFHLLILLLCRIKDRVLTDIKFTPHCTLCTVHPSP